MKVLVTGGAGYVGGVSVDAILAAGHDVVVLDDLTTGHACACVPVRTSSGARRGPGGGPGPPRGRGHRRDPPLRRRSLVGESVADPARYYRDNVAGGIALLEAAREAGVQPHRVLVDRGRLRRPDLHAHRRGRAAPTHQHLRRDEAGLRGRAVLVRRAYGLRSVILRYFNVAGATGAARSTGPRRTSSPTRCARLRAVRR